MIGPQGSGKGTQAQKLSKKFGLPIFSTGNILRQRIHTEDELGKKLSRIINNGILAPDEIVNKIIAEKIENDGYKGYILDGYPRNLAQARFLAGMDELTHVFEINISDKEAFRRITGRRTCPKCQIVYHLDYNPPREEGVCDKCGERLVIRDDDKSETVKRRLRMYYETARPLVEFYNKKKIHHLIDGEQSIEDVGRDILRVLG